MPLSLLQSQFDTLEEPTQDENFIEVDTTQSPDFIIPSILGKLRPYLNNNAS